MSWIPSDEDFDRAERLAKERSRGLDKVTARVLSRFKNLCPLHEFCIMDQIDVDFRAYVFFEKDEDIRECEDSGVNGQIVDFIYRALEHVGRGKREDITLAVEFDSDENVTANFEGDYFLRLR